MILDNVDDLTLLKAGSIQNDASVHSIVRYIPKAQSGRLLITTRDRRVGEGLSSPARTTDIGLPSLQESLQMMTSRMDTIELGLHAEGKVEELVTSLGFVPLAMMQAAAYIIETGASVDEYLEYTRTTDGDFEYLLDQDYFDQRRDADNTNSVYKSWKISFECIKRQNERAADLLALISVLDRQGIPKALLRKHISGLAPFRVALTLLIKFRLIEEQQETDMLSMHRLIHLCMQAWVRTQGTQMSWQEKALEGVDEEFPSGDFGTLAQCEKLMPHATLLMQLQLVDKDSRLRIASLHHKCGAYLMSIGSFKAAISHREVAYSKRQELLGNSHYDTLRSLSGLSGACDSDGQYERAEQLILQAIDGWQQNFGDQHQSTFSSKASLALVYQHQGNYNKSEELLRLVVNVSQRILGPGHRVSDLVYHGDVEPCPFE